MLEFLSSIRRREGLLYLLILILPFASCVEAKEEGNEVNVLIYTSMDRVVPVLLKLDGETFIEEETRAYRGMYRRVKTYANETNNINVYYKVGDRDTTFVYEGTNKKNFISILYSRWWDRFYFSPEDSVSFYDGYNDMVEYD